MVRLNDARVVRPVANDATVCHHHQVDCCHQAHITLFILLVTEMLCVLVMTYLLNLKTLLYSGWEPAILRHRLKRIVNVNDLG